MQKTASVLGVAATTAGMMAAGSSAALADSEGNDGVTVLNDANIQVLQVQLCNNNIAVAGAVLPVGSPQEASCTNAPVADHPEQEQPPAEEEPPVDEPEEPEVPDVPEPDVPDVPEPDVPDVPENPRPEEPQSPEPGGQGGAPDEDLPSAPAPTVMEGHLPVTG
ncbi:hypothetical protein GCM10027174_12730 [Salinifilum aidingensis]